MPDQPEKVTVPSEALLKLSQRVEHAAGCGTESSPISACTCGLSDAISDVAAALADPHTAEEIEATTERVLDCFKPTRAVFDMGDGHTQEINWREVVGQILYYAGQAPTAAVSPQSGLCPHCEGEIDAFGGVHLKDCPAVQSAPNPSGGVVVTEEASCENCGGKGWYVAGDAPHDESHTYPEACPDCAGAKAGDEEDYEALGAAAAQIPGLAQVGPGEWAELAVGLRRAGWALAALGVGLQDSEDDFEFCDNCERPARDGDLETIWCRDAESGEQADARICLACRLEQRLDQKNSRPALICTKCGGIADGPLEHPGPEMPDQTVFSPRPTIDEIEAAMGRALKAAQAELRPLLGKRAAVVINVATADCAFGSRVPSRAPKMLAESLRASAEEAR
jgi:hypothetical protein